MKGPSWRPPRAPEAAALPCGTDGEGGGGSGAHVHQQQEPGSPRGRSSVSTVSSLTPSQPPIEHRPELSAECRWTPRLGRKPKAQPPTEHTQPRGTLRAGPGDAGAASGRANGCTSPREAEPVLTCQSQAPRAGRHFTATEGACVQRCLIFFTGNLETSRLQGERE